MNKENNEYGEALSQLIISAMKMPPAIRAQLIQALLDRGSDLPQADNVRQELFLHVKEQFDVLLLDTDIDEIIHIVNPYMFTTKAKLFAAEQELEKTKEQVRKTRSTWAKAYVKNIYDNNEYQNVVTSELTEKEEEIKSLNIREKHYLDVVELQKAELEKLREKNERLKNSFDEVFNQRNSIQSKNERLEDENEQFRKLYMDALDHRAKLREALDGIIDEVHTTRHDWGENMENIDRIAKEALKGGSDE